MDIEISSLKEVVIANAPLCGKKKTHYENDTFDADNKLVPSKNSDLPHSN
jgi:hypothetical protein